MSQYLIVLAVIPLSVFYITKMTTPHHRWLLTGLATGLVIAPVSMGLIEFTYVPIIGKALGLVGIIGNLIHGSIGYFFLVSLGGLEPGVLLNASQLVTISLVNAAIWGSYYGMVGYHIDAKLATEVIELEMEPEAQEYLATMKQKV